MKSTSFLDFALMRGDTYYYKVVAVSERNGTYAYSVASPYSAVKYLKVK